MSSMVSQQTLPQAEVAYSWAQETEGVELQAVIYLRVGQEERTRAVPRFCGDLGGRTDDDDTDQDRPTGSTRSRPRPSPSLTSTPAVEHPLTSTVKRVLITCSMTSHGPLTDSTPEGSPCPIDVLRA